MFDCLHELFVSWMELGNGLDAAILTLGWFGGWMYQGMSVQVPGLIVSFQYDFEGIAPALEEFDELDTVSVKVLYFAADSANP